MTAGEAWLQAAVAYHFAKFVWVLDDRAQRAGARRARRSTRCTTAHRLLGTGLERLEFPLDGTALAANLRRPAGEERPPLVILIPGLDSTKEEFFRFSRAAFLRRGMATLSLDGPGQGEAADALPIRREYEVGGHRGARRCLQEPTSTSTGSALSA